MLCVALPAALNALQPGLAEATRSILATQVVHNNRGAEWTPNFLRGARDTPLIGRT